MSVTALAIMAFAAVALIAVFVLIRRAPEGREENGVFREGPSDASADDSAESRQSVREPGDGRD